MLDKLKKHWAALRAGKPGERFFKHYQQRREAHASSLRHILILCAGALIALAGLVLMPAPGPGMVVVAGGAALLAGESKMVAKLLDRIELAARKLIRRFKNKSGSEPN